MLFTSNFGAFVPPREDVQRHCQELISWRSARKRFRRDFHIPRHRTSGGYPEAQSPAVVAQAAAGEPSLWKKSAKEKIVMPLNFNSIPVAGVAIVATLFLASALSAAPPAHPGNSLTASGLESHESLRSSRLLKDLQVVTSELNRHAETLGTFATRPEFSWQSHASYLNDVREQINEAGVVIKELQDMQHAVAPWQQEAISRIHPVALQLANHTEAAIVHLNENQNLRFVSEYRDRLTAISDHSSDLKNTIDRFVDYGETQRKLNRLEGDLDLASS
jgi:hypothetical protein